MSYRKPLRMPPLLCAKSGLRFTCKPYPTHTMVIMMKKWFVVHLHTTPNPFLEFNIQKKVVCGGLRWFGVVCGGLGWFAVVCGGLR